MNQRDGSRTSLPVAYLTPFLDALRFAGVTLFGGQIGRPFSLPMKEMDAMNECVFPG
jgi:hypothetical protein